jgi:hypothetical protein
MQDRQEQIQTTTNLNEVSFYFFFILSLTHILSGLLVVNEIYVKPAWLINRLLDIPFLWITLLYFYSNIKLYLLKQKIYSHSYELLLITLFTTVAAFAFIADLVFSNQLPQL